MLLSDFHPTYFILQQEGDVVVATFEMSQLSDDENIEQMGRELFALVDHYDCRRIVIDLRRVEYLTSSVLGKLITLHRRLHRSDGVLVLCHITPPVRGILEASRLDSYFRTCDETGCAVEMARAS